VPIRRFIDRLPARPAGWRWTSPGIARIDSFLRIFMWRRFMSTVKSTAVLRAWLCVSLAVDLAVRAPDSGSMP